ncbi:hypothetical protein UB39_10035 [Photobacterium angustum]|nr:hypothetical protein UB39_10035 [Photobacterium angustum]
MNYYPTAAIITEQRFGFGPKLNDQHVLSLSEQISTKPYIGIALQSLPSTNNILVQIGLFNQQRKKLKKIPQ